jgi:transcription elongation GreA/GreB family factor
MSRAFVKEGDGALDPLPDLPLSTHPIYVTLRGLADLQARLQQMQTTLATLKSRAERLDKLPEAAAERDIRYLEARLRSAIPVNPAQHDLLQVAFGLSVQVCDPSGREQVSEITGEDEADPTLGRISAHSPLARALIGAEVGDSVTWKKPNGPIELKISAITCPKD